VETTTGGQNDPPAITRQQSIDSFFAPDAGPGHFIVFRINLSFFQSLRRLFPTMERRLIHSSGTRHPTRAGDCAGDTPLTVAAEFRRGWDAPSCATAAAMFQTACPHFRGTGIIKGSSHLHPEVCGLWANARKRARAWREISGWDL
jgi:hypothetical protein